MCSLILQSKTQFCATWANYNLPHLVLAFFHPSPFSTWMETEMASDFISSGQAYFPDPLKTSKTKQSWHGVANEQDLLPINFSSFGRMKQLLTCPPLFVKHVGCLLLSASFPTILSPRILNDSPST